MKKKQKKKRRTRMGKKTREEGGGRSQGRTKFKSELKLLDSTVFIEVCYDLIHNNVSTYNSKIWKDERWGDTKSKK